MDNFKNTYITNVFIDLFLEKILFKNMSHTKWYCLILGKMGENIVSFLSKMCENIVSFQGKMGENIVSFLTRWGKILFPF